MYMANNQIAPLHTSENFRAPSGYHTAKRTRNSVGKATVTYEQKCISKQKLSEMEQCYNALWNRLPAVSQHANFNVVKSFTTYIT